MRRVFTISSSAPALLVSSYEGYSCPKVYLELSMCMVVCPHPHCFAPKSMISSRFALKHLHLGSFSRMACIAMQEKNETSNAPHKANVHTLNQSRLKKEMLPQVRFELTTFALLVQRSTN
ncbi:hypothetical protein BOTBODRAFT_338914 [Botryobasidium botryosum FD-172 SS1]|uniref:Uncharacterized protein n=1 Tax=Botryobasidium botryosum (strain FD-172 SS1) TaxID=930990 RepID=A0A067MIZ6_BOTB1|nr:hypothetical protein BOTBODRAFT_338914 [Botryobasidium botryosum FD-172 SS1]